MICGGCQKKLKPGDLYIEDTPTGYIGKESLGEELEALLVDLMTHNDNLDGGSDRLIFCEACTDPTREGKYYFQVFTSTDD